MEKQNDDHEQHSRLKAAPTGYLDFAIVWDLDLWIFCRAF